MLKDVERTFNKNPLSTLMSELGGIDYLQKKIQTTIEYSLLKPEVFRNYGAEPSVGILLTGPTGIGKTALANAIFNKLIEMFMQQSQQTESVSE